MKVKFRETPTPHLLLSDIFTCGELEEMMFDLSALETSLLTPESTGTAGVSGLQRKQNRGLYLDDGELPARKALDRVSSSVLTRAWRPQWLADLYDSVTDRRVLYSLYEDGDRYLSHRDAALFTTLIWVHADPKPFTGGTLILSDYGIEVEPDSNTGIIFLSHEYHEVTPVKGSGRHCLTVFLNKGL